MKGIFISKAYNIFAGLAAFHSKFTSSTFSFNDDILCREEYQSIQHLSGIDSVNILVL